MCYVTSLRTLQILWVIILFYTDGISVWDKTHSLMPSCTTTPLNGDPSSTQSGVIVPKPGSTSIYYIFTTPAQVGFWGTTSPMCYSIVDMSLNGGNGDLTITNVPIIDSSVEKIAVVGNCNGSAYWVVGHKWNCDSFYAFKLTSLGLSAPVKTKIGIVHSDIGSANNAESIGYMKFSSDAKKIGLVTYVNLNTMQIFDFDENTGILSNPITDVIPFDPNNSTDGLYGCTFSPDNSKFYMSYYSFGQSKVYQYDLNAGNASAIIDSRTIVATNASIFSAIQNGPNWKLYISTSSNTLDVINSPNSIGLACSYVAAAQSLGSASGTFGLPTIVESFLTVISTPKFNMPSSTSICIGDTIFAPQTIKNVFSISPSNSVSVNSDSSIVQFFPTTTTTYTIVNYGNCSSFDTSYLTISIVPNPIANFIFIPSSPTLADPTISLQNMSTNAVSYAWYQNNLQIGTTTDYVTNNPGLGNFCYTLVAFNTLGCSNSITKCVTVEDTIVSTIFIPNAFSPNADGKNDVFYVKGSHINLLSFIVYDRFGEQLFNTPDINVGWNGSYFGKSCEIGTYYYSVIYSDIKGKQQLVKGDINLLR